MERKFIEYASKLDVIGDLINEVSNSIPTLDSNNVYTISELVTYKEQLNGAMERFQFIVNELNDMDVPELVMKDHELLTTGVSSFVRGCTLMKDSVSIEDKKIDRKQLLQGDSIRIIGVKEVLNATKNIGDKLVKL
jgi:hypothetical protein